MALHVMRWQAMMMPDHGPGAYMPIDINFDPNKPTNDNRLRLSQIENKPVRWHVFVEFPGPLDPQDPDYPHYCEVHDNQDFAVLEFNCKWSSKAGIQYGLPGSLGSIPSELGKHGVRFTLLNENRQPLLSEGTSYFLDAG